MKRWAAQFCMAWLAVAVSGIEVRCDEPAPAPYRLRLENGTDLRGRLEGIAEEGPIRWLHAAGGGRPWRFPVGTAVSIVREEAGSFGTPAPHGIRLRDGGWLPGRIRSIAGGFMEIEGPVAVMRLDLQRVAGIRFDRILGCLVAGDAGAAPWEARDRAVIGEGGWRLPAEGDGTLFHDGGRHRQGWLARAIPRLPTDFQMELAWIDPPRQRRINLLLATPDHPEEGEHDALMLIVQPGQVNAVYQMRRGTSQQHMHRLQVPLTGETGLDPGAPMLLTLQVERSAPAWRFRLLLEDRVLGEWTETEAYPEGWPQEVRIQAQGVETFRIGALRFAPWVGSRAEAPESMRANGVDRLTLGDGSVHAGFLLGILDEKLRFRTEKGVDLVFPIAEVSSLQCGGTVEPQEGSDVGRPDVVLRWFEGGRLSLRLERVEDGILYGHLPGGDAVQVALERIRSIEFFRGTDGSE